MGHQVWSFSAHIHVYVYGLNVMFFISHMVWPSALLFQSQHITAFNILQLCIPPILQPLKLSLQPIFWNNMGLREVICTLLWRMHVEWHKQTIVSAIFKIFACRSSTEKNALVVGRVQDLQHILQVLSIQCGDQSTSFLCSSAWYLLICMLVHILHIASIYK